MAARSGASPSGAAREQRAELVASHAVRGGVRADRRLEAGGHALQEGVTRRVAEVVVVALESVEVEQDEHERLGIVIVKAIAQGGGEGSAIAQPRERIGERLARGAAQHRLVGAEGHHEAEQDAEQRPAGQRDGREGHVGDRALPRGSRG